MEPNHLDAKFAALADPTRRAILTRLVAGEATVTELAAPFALTQPAISKHLKVLEAAGLISRSRIAQTRPCRLEVDAIKEVASWIDTYRALWETSFDRLDSYLARENGAAMQAPTAHAPATPASTKKETNHGRTKR